MCGNLVTVLLTLAGSTWGFTSQDAESPEARERTALELPLPALTFDELEDWRNHVRPTPPELAWEAIPWLPTFAEGVRAADAQGKPLLFWAMNGHPLGCT